MWLLVKVKITVYQKGMTQAELAEKLFVTFQIVNKWENDINQQDISTLQLIGNFF